MEHSICNQQIYSLCLRGRAYACVSAWVGDGQRKVRWNLLTKNEEIHGERDCFQQLPVCTALDKTTWEMLPGLIILKIMINKLLVPYLKHREQEKLDQCSSTNAILRRKTVNMSWRGFRDELRVGISFWWQLKDYSVTQNWCLLASRQLLVNCLFWNIVKFLEMKTLNYFFRGRPSVTVCLTCPTSVTIFVARRKHGSFSMNIQEELEAALLFQELFIRLNSSTDCLRCS